MRYTEELELLQIATLTGLGEGIIKGHLYRALVSVRAQVRRLR
jgi:DNA-directed RNA polymerase specialized sigma24 family protein